MKKLMLLFLAICMLCSACGRNLPKNEEIIVDDFPYSIGEQYEKTSVRMINVDGELYFDSGLASELMSRCGTLDGKLRKAVGENEIPQKSGEANFEAEGYQNATSITKEVFADGEWRIFKKFDTFGNSTEELKFCHFIKGRLNNADEDSELIVLSEYEDVTLNNVYEPLLSAQYPVDRSRGKILHRRKNTDEWGIELRSENVGRNGLTLIVEQFGGNAKGELQTGAAFRLDKIVDDEWKALETKNGDPVWIAIAHLINKNDITELEINWENVYGSLEPGFYHLSKEITDFRAAGDFDKKQYEIWFTID